MLIQQKKGNIYTDPNSDKSIDWLTLAWYETNKRILHKSTRSGKQMILKFLKADPQFCEGDILAEDDNNLIVIEILPAETIVITPGTMQQMAALCYEIGNKHLPLFLKDEEVLVPFEAPLFQWLTATGFAVKKEDRKLMQPLRTSTMAHNHNSTGESLFSKILQLTKSSTDE